MLCDCISAREVRIVRFIAKCVRCDKFIAVNFARMIYVVSMR
jgi:hypothetical protein